MTDALEPGTDVADDVPMAGPSSAPDGRDPPGPSAPIDDDDDLDFNNMKKKKKKKKVAFYDLEDEKRDVSKDEKDGSADQEGLSMRGTDQSGGHSGATDAWRGSDRDYTYDELLQRVFNIMREKDPDMVAGDKKKLVMKPPQVSDAR